MMNYKISVIIPIYNMEKYIRDSIDSILQQTLQGIEIICIDDGSSDKSLEILYGYASKNNNIKVYVQNHQYAGVARNLGIQKARGEYLAFLDADDFYESDTALEELYLNAKEQSAIICVGQLHNYFCGERLVEGYKDIVFEETGYRPYIIQNVNERPLTLHYSAIFERKFILSNKIEFGTWKSSEDVYFCLIAYSLAGKYFAINKNVYHRRVVDKIYSSKEDYQGELYCWSEILFFLYSHHRSNEMLYSYVLLRVNQYIKFIYANVTKDNMLLLHKIRNVFCKDKEAVRRLENTQKISMDIYINQKDIDNCLNKINKKYQEFMNLTGSFNKIWLYGAGIVGRTVAKYLFDHEICKIQGFVISKGNNYVDSLFNVNVNTIDSADINWEHDLIFITAHKQHIRDMKQLLNEYGSKHYHVIDYDEFITYI